MYQSSAEHAIGMFAAFEQVGIGVATTVSGTVGMILLLLIGVVGTAICTGAFAQQVGTKLLAIPADQCVNSGFQLGIPLGVAYTLLATLQLGSMGAFYSLLGLWTILLLVSLLIWCVGREEQKAP
ncbi:MAG: hypothetical protein U0103_16530 [Candidatus Obscuribacterales bacterium]